MAAAVMPAGMRERFKESPEVDLAYSVAGLGRFRCSVFQQRGTVGLVLRVIPVQIRTVEDLEPPGGHLEDRRRGARARPGDRHDGQRQEHDAGRHGGPHQPDAAASTS